MFSEYLDVNVTGHPLSEKMASTDWLRDATTDSDVTSVFPISLDNVTGSQVLPEEMLAVWKSVVEQRTIRPGLLAWYTKGYSVLCGVALVFSIITLCGLCRPKNKSNLSNLLLTAQTVIDIFLVLSAFFLITMLPWSMHLFPAADRPPDSFWTYLEVAQEVFMVTAPLMDMACAMTLWYGLALVLEQYYAYKKPLQLRHMSKSDGYGKAVISVICVAVIVHLVTFFKYTRTEYSAVHYKRLCISPLYRGSFFKTLDKYIYFILVYYIPWLALLGATIKAAMTAVAKAKKASMEEQTMNVERGSGNRGSRDLGSVDQGRSPAAVFTLSAMLFLLYGGVLGIRTYLYIIGTDGALSEYQRYTQCQFMPIDTRFIFYDDVFRFATYILFISYVIIKFPVLLVTSSNFRNCIARRFKCPQLPDLATGAVRKRSLESKLLMKMQANTLPSPSPYGQVFVIHRLTEPQCFINLAAFDLDQER